MKLKLCLSHSDTFCQPVGDWLIHLRGVVAMFTLYCFTLCLRSGEEDSSPAARGEEDSGVSRGWSRHRRMVPGARRPPPEGELVLHCQMLTG